jgi:hypothetical protein
MNGRNAERARQLAREKALYRYSSALDRGDFEGVSAVLKQAEQDAAMERMLLEVNEVYRAEVEGEPTRATLASGAVKDARRRRSFARLLGRTRNAWRKGQGRRERRKPRVGRRVWSGNPIRNGLVAGGVVLGIALVFAIGFGIYTASGHHTRTTALMAEPAVVATAAAEARQPVEHVVEQVVVEKDVEVEADYYAPALPALAPLPAPREVERFLGLSQPTERLIIRDGSISMVVKDTYTAQQAIEEMVAEMAGEGAYVVSSEEHGEVEEGSPYITMSIRVPAARFDEAMNRLADLAVQVTARTESGQDVTEEYVDLNARLESLEATRERLLGIMQDTRTTDELLKAEQQLTQREAEIESIKERLQYLAQSARLARIWIELQPYVLSQPVGTRWRPAEAARGAVETLTDSLQGLGDFLIFFVIAILPWAVTLGLVVYGVVQLVLWRVRVSREKHAASDSG